MSIRRLRVSVLFVAVILELLEFCLTPCSRIARSMGFLKSTIQVRARFKRCRAAWFPHLQHTKAAILSAARQAPERRKALLFGAGLLHDIPLRELSAMFEEVILADIVHSLPCRFAASRFSNVRLLALDVTGVAAGLAAAQRRPDLPLPRSNPAWFLNDSHLDLSVSVNLLSQLSWVPSHFLAHSHPEAEVAAMKTQLILAHLEYLQRLPGQTALITDTTWRAVPVQEINGGPPASDAAQTWDVLSGVNLPMPALAWDWCIAPAPERAQCIDYIARVHAYPDWKRCVLPGN